MIFFQKGLYVTIKQLETELAPVPKPLSHGFATEFAYLVLGAFTLSESGEAYLVLSNNENQIWFISNRHLRTYQLRPGSTAFRLRVTSEGKKKHALSHQNGAHSIRRQAEARNGAASHSQPTTRRRSARSNT